MLCFCFSMPIAWKLRKKIRNWPYNQPLLPSLKLTCNTDKNRSGPKIQIHHPTINFQGRAVSFSKDNCFEILRLRIPQGFHKIRASLQSMNTIWGYPSSKSGEQKSQRYAARSIGVVFKNTSAAPKMWLNCGRFIGYPVIERNLRALDSTPHKNGKPFFGKTFSASIWSWKCSFCFGMDLKMSPSMLCLLFLPSECTLNKNCVIDRLGHGVSPSFFRLVLRSTKNNIN